MRKLILIPILLIVALSSQAQERKARHHDTSKQITPEQRAEMMTKRMTEELSLTKDQQEKIHQLSLERAKQHAEQAKLAKERALLMKAENAKNREEIEKVLTPEQRTKWDELKSKRDKSRRIKGSTGRKDFKRKPSMIKKKDSIDSKKPASKITPIVTEAQ